MRDLKIYGAIKKYVKKNPVRFHMPAHKGRKFLNPCAKYDITELSAVNNSQVVKAAEKDCEKILGVKNVLFLTGGATSGILIALFAIREKGKKIIINRSAHKSVYNGLKLFEIEPVIIDDARENITTELIFNVFKKEKDVAAVFLTYPDYFGRTFDLKGIKAVCEKAGKVLITDSAHGNHFKFCGLPYAGNIADISVESLHKTARTFNQGAIIIVNDRRFFDKAEEGANTFLTTSPSYPLLSSIEYGIKRQAKDVKRAKNIIGYIDKAKEKLQNAGLKILPAEDPFKLTVLFGESGYDGLKIAACLEKRGIFPELVGKNEILFMSSPATKKWEIIKLFKAVLFAIKDKSNSTEYKSAVNKGVPKRVMPYLTAVNAEWEFTPIESAEGKICAENFGTIPPCRPLYVAGEIIDNIAAEELFSQETFGVYEGKVKTVKVN